MTDGHSSTTFLEIEATLVVNMVFWKKQDQGLPDHWTKDQFKINQINDMIDCTPTWLKKISRMLKKK